jgi:hypothetical protein
MPSKTPLLEGLDRRIPPAPGCDSQVWRDQPPRIGFEKSLEKKKRKKRILAGDLEDIHVPSSTYRSTRESTETEKDVFPQQRGDRPDGTALESLPPSPGDETVQRPKFPRQARRS